MALNTPTKGPGSSCIGIRKQFIRQLSGRVQMMV